MNFFEGIGDTDSLGENWSENKKSDSLRSFKSLVEVLRFCEARLLRKNIEFIGNHYSNVSQALYLEASELKAFLGHVLHDLDTSEKPTTYSFQTKTYIKEWAKLWIEVMGEVRQKTKEIKTQTDESAEIIAPETEYYKCTPFTRENLENTEELQASIKSSKSLDDLETLPEDAESRIFDFLKSRVSSHDELNTSRSMTPDSLDDLDDLDFEPQTKVPSEKKKLGVHDKLVRKISDWDQYSLDDTLEKDFLNGNFETSDDKNTGNKNDTEVELDAFSDSMSSLRRFTAPVLSSHKKRISKSEMCLHQIDIDEITTENFEQEDLCKVGASLTEIFKIRQELTRAELQFSQDPDVLKQKKCFGCHKNKFTFFQRARMCAVCKKKYCINCLTENVPIPPSLTETLPPNVDVTYNANQPSSNLVRSKSMLYVGPSTTIKQLPWQRDAKVKGVRLSMCNECHVFVDSIKKERERIEWKVQLELDL